MDYYYNREKRATVQQRFALVNKLHQKKQLHLGTAVAFLIVFFSFLIQFYCLNNRAYGSNNSAKYLYNKLNHQIMYLSSNFPLVSPPRYWKLSNADIRRKANRHRFGSTSIIIISQST